MLGLGLSGSLLADCDRGTARRRGAWGATDLHPDRGAVESCACFWQAPTILNAHLATGTKDREASRVVYEPLFSVNPEAEFIPILVAEIPAWRTAVVRRTAPGPSGA